MVVVGRADQRIAQLAERQYGRVARWQLLRAGVSPEMIKGRVARGALVRVARGVYAVGHLAGAGLACEIEALLALPHGAMLSHLTAARLWKIHRPAASRYVDLMVAPRSMRRRAGVRVHRSQDFDRCRQHYLYNLPVTPVPLTLLQIAPLLTGWELERAIDEAVARKLTTLDKLRQLAEGRRGRPGATLFRQLLDARIDGAGVSKEGVERELLALIRKARLPEPRRNVQIGEFSADFYWPELRVAVETQSYQWHLVKTNYERDNRKQIAFKRAAIDLTLLTWDAVTRRQIETTALLATVLTRGAARRG